MKLYSVLEPELNSIVASDSVIGKSKYCFSFGSFVLSTMIVPIFLTKDMSWDGFLNNPYFLTALVATIGSFALGFMFEISGKKTKKSIIDDIKNNSRFTGLSCCPGKVFSRSCEESFIAANIEYLKGAK